MHSVVGASGACPVLAKIVQRCRGVDLLAGDRGQLFLPLCSLHQICYLCVRSSFHSSCAILKKMLSWDLTIVFSYRARLHRRPATWFSFLKLIRLAKAIWVVSGLLALRWWRFESCTTTWLTSSTENARPAPACLPPSSSTWAGSELSSDRLSTHACDIIQTRITSAMSHLMD